MGDVAAGEKIFKTKCAQCHVAEKGGGHKQVSRWRRQGGDGALVLGFGVGVAMVMVTVT